MTPSTHDLNKRLAEFCGKNIYWEPHGQKWCLKDDPFTEWNPCEDHNQMAVVKVALREKKIEHESRYDLSLKKYTIRFSEPGMLLTGYTKITGHHESELLAFALAVKALKEGEK